MSHHSRPPKEKGLSPARRPLVGHRSATRTCVARRVRAASSSALPPPQRQRAQARSRARCAGLALEVTATRRRREASRRAAPLYGTDADQALHGVAHARSKLTSCASSPETTSACARAPRDTRRKIRVGGRCWHITPRLSAEGERPLDSETPFFNGAHANPRPRSLARPRRKLECCASSPEIASAGSPEPSNTRRWLGVGGCC